MEGKIVERKEFSDGCLDMMKATEPGSCTKFIFLMEIEIKLEDVEDRAKSLQSVT